jgi:hypothetical protein
MHLAEPRDVREEVHTLAENRCSCAACSKRACCQGNIPQHQRPIHDGWRRLNEKSPTHFTCQVAEPGDLYIGVTASFKYGAEV